MVTVAEVSELAMPHSPRVHKAMQENDAFALTQRRLHIVEIHVRDPPGQGALNPDIPVDQRALGLAVAVGRRRYHWFAAQPAKERLAEEIQQGYGKQVAGNHQWSACHAYR